MVHCSTPGPNQNRSLHSAAPPADNSTGFCACTLYLVFKEPTPTEPDTRSRWPSPVSFRPSLGEPSKVTTEDLPCQYLAKLFLLVIRSGTKKLLRIFFGATVRLAAGSRLPNQNWNPITIHALGVGFPRPLRRFDLSGYWLSRLNRLPNPARAI